MSTRSHLTSELKEILSALWEEGMTTLKRKDLVKKAVDRTVLEEQTIKVVIPMINDFIFIKHKCYKEFLAEKNCI